MMRDGESEIVLSNEKSEEEARAIPAEVIMEVLSWLPLKPLARAQLVCKQWQALIQHHHFMEEHMSRSSCIRYWYNISLPAANPNPDILISFLYIHGCDGLLLMKNKDSGNHILWNPATRRVLDLPAPHQGSYGLALSFVPLTGNYRVVSFFKDSGKHGCELLTPGSSMAWRPSTFPFPDVVNANADAQLVPAGGVVHCIVGEAEAEAEAEIVSLDVETERFTLNRLPGGVFAPTETARAIDSDGKLALAAVVGHHLQLMVLQDFKKNRWCRDKEVIPLPFMKNKGFKGKTVVAMSKKGGDIRFWLKNEKLFVYTIGTRKTIDVQPSTGFLIRSILSSYKPSLATFEGMRGDEEFDACRPSYLKLD